MTGADRTSKPLLRCSLLLHSTLTPLPGQWDRGQSSKYTLGATFIIISQNFLIEHLNLLGVRPRRNIKIFYGMQLPHVWHFTHGQAWRQYFPINSVFNGFSVTRRPDQNSKGGGALLYVRDKIIVLPLNRYSLPPHIEISFLELNLRNQKWLVCCSYNPHKNLIKDYLRVLIEGIQFY